MKGPFVGSCFVALGRTTSTWVGTDDLANTDVNGDGVIDWRDFRAWVAANPTYTTGAPVGTNMVQLNANAYDTNSANTFVSGNTTG